MSSSPPARRLAGGVEMPALGVGSYQVGPGREAQESFACALGMGYRLVDTSLAYGNERDLAVALRAVGLPRDRVFITSKVENEDQGFDETLRAFERTVANLRTDHLDLYLVHWPVPDKRAATWRALQRLHDEGSCRAIGVSNYQPRHLQELLAWADTPPAVDQVEFHPFLYQKELLETCRARHVQLEAYAPLAKARRLDDPILTEIAAEHGVSAAQVMLRWAVQHDVIPIPRSAEAGHLRQNFAIWDFELSDEEMARLDGLDEGLRTDWDPTTVP
jgi:diketogulonate reductase-like aldo/keto reductase